MSTWLKTRPEGKRFYVKRLLRKARKMKTAAPAQWMPPQPKTREIAMFERQINQKLFERQYDSPLAQDLLACAMGISALAGRIGESEWADLCLIRMQIMALAGQVNGLLIPGPEEA